RPIEGSDRQQQQWQQDQEQADADALDADPAPGTLLRGRGSGLLLETGNGELHEIHALQVLNRAQPRPVCPKPPVPRSVAVISSTTSKWACTTVTSTFWAMRSPGLMVKGLLQRYQEDTNSCPW